MAHVLFAEAAGAEAALAASVEIGGQQVEVAPLDPKQAGGMSFHSRSGSGRGSHFGGRSGGRGDGARGGRGEWTLV